ncbi:hypothetical protein CK203_113663 [Vitis vinifera]|uniref:Uncharacterized protein n=1 Tax=Vitis vinifera TaxID=29760 RepID=A0A438CZ43_VITVI|nr:hypothetical protein CK203_113663 [Vitis vinifera]
MDEYDSLWCRPGSPAGPEHPEIPYPEQPEEPQPVEIPVDITPSAPTVASSEPIPDVAPFAPQATPRTPLLFHPYQSHPIHLSLGLLYPLSRADFRHSDPAYCHLEAVQHHLGIISAPEHPIPIPPEPSQAPPFVHQTMPPEEPTTGEAEAEVPLPPYNLNRSCHIEDNVQLGWGES